MMGSTAGGGKKSQHSIPTDILDDLCRWANFF